MLSPEYNQFARYNGDAFYKNKWLIPFGKNSTPNTTSYSTISRSSASKIIYHDDGSATLGYPSGNHHTIENLTKYTYSEIDQSYVYSNNRSEYPDDDIQDGWLYQYMGESVISSAGLIMYGTCTANETITTDFKPQFAISMNTTTGTSNTPIMCFHMINNAIMLYNNGGYQTYDEVLTAYRSGNKLTDTGFKVPFNGRYFVIG